MLIKYNSTSTVDASPRNPSAGAIVPMSMSFGNMGTTGTISSSSAGMGNDDYEYNPDALGVVTKRTWNASTDLAYEEDIKVKNNRTKRPVSQLSGKQASVSNIDNGAAAAGGGGGISRQSSLLIKQPSMKSRQSSMRK